MGNYVIRLEKIKGKNGVLIALKHNKRELQAEHGARSNIDTSRTKLNYSLTGTDTAKQIDIDAQVLMVQAGIQKIRKDAVMAVEILFSLPIDRHQQENKQFFQNCLEWTKQSIPGVLLSFDVHLDESAPHAHALILPLVNGRMIGSEIVGGKENLNRLRNKFYAEIAMSYGLGKSKRLTKLDKEYLAKSVISKLITDKVMKSAIWACVRDSIQKDPLPYAELLGIKPRNDKKRKSFVQIMTSKGKGTDINPI